jgi:hypothetical protein
MPVLWLKNHSKSGAEIVGKSLKNDILEGKAYLSIELRVESV